MTYGGTVAHSRQDIQGFMVQCILLTLTSEFLLLKFGYLVGKE